MDPREPKPPIEMNTSELATCLRDHARTFWRGIEEEGQRNARKTGEFPNSTAYREWWDSFGRHVMGVAADQLDGIGENCWDLVTPGCYTTIQDYIEDLLMSEAQRTEALRLLGVELQQGGFWTASGDATSGPNAEVSSRFDGPERAAMVQASVWAVDRECWGQLEDERKAHAAKRATLEGNIEGLRRKVKDLLSHQEELKKTIAGLRGQIQTSDQAQDEGSYYTGIEVGMEVAETLANWPTEAPCEK